VTGSNERVYYAWVLNNGTLDFITTILSHELVEAYTDLEGAFIQIASSSSSNWNEVTDVCRLSAFFDGVLVQSYWSQDQNACVIPFYNFADIRNAVPAGLDLQVIAIRRAWSRERKSFWIQETKLRIQRWEIRSKSSALMPSYLLKMRTLSLFGDRGSTSKGCDQAGSQSRCA
jgi:hypothetical protein